MAAARINQQTLETLRSLQSEGDPDIILEISDLFFTTSPVKIEKIEQSLSAGQISAARAEAHGLKSSAYALGAEILASICQSIENLGDHEPFKDLALNLRKEYDSTATELKKVAAEMSSGRI